MIDRKLWAFVITVYLQLSMLGVYNIKHSIKYSKRVLFNHLCPGTPVSIEHIAY